MTSVIGKLPLALSLACLFMLASDPAHALRCGQRLVKDGMYEEHVVEICGEPVSRRHLGYVLRPYILKRPAGILNFGPRKLMRVLRFEGGRLTSIRTMGYGYRE